MALINAEMRDRIGHWVRTLKEDLYEPLGKIQWEASRTMEQLSLEKALAQDFTAVEPGYTWGETYEYCWFKGSITLPAEAEGKRIVMKLSPGGESTLFVNGISFGTYRADWVQEPHHYYEDNTLSRSARAGERYDIVMETYAGHFFPGLPGSATGPVLPGSFQDPAIPGKRSTLGVSTYGIWDETAYGLFMDVDTLGRLLSSMDQTTMRAVRIAEALEEFTRIVDFEQDKPARTADYARAREMLRPVLAAHNGDTQAEIYAIGNAHIDLAWLWPMAETYRKTSRTFAAQLRLLEEYPEYKYLQSQPAAYEMCRTYYPELYDRIREAIREGRWIAEGAMWVEPDTNMPSGEALIRQLVHGKRYYKEELGTDSVILWLPDTFGYSAALPQILKGCGVKYLVTQKIFWSYNEGEMFPYHYFTWQGMDGSQVISFLPTSYTYSNRPDEVNKVWKERRQTRDLDAFLYPFGYGDGGGGPARDHVEHALRQKDLEGGVKVRMENPRDFFEDMEKKGGPKNTYVGELYFTAHRGTLTSQATVKRNNRKAELALRELEMWGCAAMLAKAAGIHAAGSWQYPLGKADALWKQVLLHQFHDILPGSGMGRIYEDTEKVMNQVLADTAALTKEAASAILTADDSTVTVYNSLPFDRAVIVTLPASFAGGAVNPDGTPVPVTRTGEGVKAALTLPGCGGITLRAVPQEEQADPAGEESTAVGADSRCPDRAPQPVRALRTEEGFLLENDLVRAIVDVKGEVTSFVLKESGREFAAAPMNHLRFYKDIPRRYDAWDIDSNYTEMEIEGVYDVTAELEADGLEAVVRLSGKIGNSSYSQRIRLAAGSRRLEFETEVDWKELHRLLKAAFPVEVYAENAINEIQFGYVERPTHRSRQYEKDRFEVCNHHYTALKDGSHGAAVLNDCKYGISVNQNSMELTLLRASASPEMRADNRLHRFTYAFTAWEGDFQSADVVRQGYEVNVEPLVLSGALPDALNGQSLFRVQKENVILDTLKPAEDGSGDLILRLYESKKAAVTTTLSLNPVYFKGKWEAELTDMLENVTEDLALTDNTVTLPFRAFEVKTVRLSKRPS